jgi:beta-glucosidase
MAFGQELHWDWRKINTSISSFPRTFLWGVTTTAHQVEGDCSNNWSRWEEACRITPAGKACDHWQRCFDDIRLLKELGVRSYRFSVEWSKIEPQQGVINKAVLQHYQDFCAALKAAGIMPVVTLYAATHPLWFDEQGAFERDHNISLFVNFAEIVFKALHEHVGMWCTMNEPAMCVFQGYMRATFPPGKNNAGVAGQVLKNLLQAHCMVYKRLKSLPSGDKASIGIAHTMVHFDPYRDWNPLDVIAGKVLTDITNNSVIEFFKTGTLRFEVEGIVASHLGWQASLVYNEPFAMRALDFFGINYYSHVLINSLTGKDEYRSNDIPTDMSYAFYPEGMYRAIVQASSLKVPLYITENGIADAKDDRREEWCKRYLYALHKALCEGYDVRGYFYRSLMDCFEWDKGYEMKFGLYHVDFTTQKRTLKKGASYFIKTIQTSNARSE